ncbi:MAG: hemolysin III family protein [Gammaproteobacteria bacterium]|nr:hemolysin III family protein [Gammaproteobacteria bacterium]
MFDPITDTKQEVANASSHGLALLAACLATPKLLAAALPLGVRAHQGVMVFAATMLLLYSASTLYHALPSGRVKQFFLKLDHAAIYLFIAGSYTPFALSQPSSLQSVIALSLVWAAAAAGFLMKTLTRHGSTLWSTGLYVAMGWLVLLAALPLIKPMPPLGTAWLVIGGVAYTLGVVFYALDATVRYAHAVWHACVATGTTCHVFAVLSVLDQAAPLRH